MPPPPDDPSSPQVRVFRAGPMDYTPFSADDSPEEFKRAGIGYVDDPGAADIILARNALPLQRLRNRPARFAIWTNEPRFDTHIASPVRIYAITPPVHVMNVYTGVFADNYLSMWEHNSPLDRAAMMEAFAAKPWRAVMLATYYPPGSLGGPRLARPDFQSMLEPKPDGRMLWHGRDIDLTQRRQSLALHLQQRGFCDIYGRDWPATVTVSGESRLGNRRDAKHEVLRNYAVNLAFENTVAPYYVSEKLWEAIKGGCLPVYHGADGSSIYEDFPPGSFIEAAGKSDEALAEEIMAMGRREATERYAACLDVYLRLVGEERHRRSAASYLARTADFLRAVMQAPESAEKAGTVR